MEFYGKQVVLRSVAAQLGCGRNTANGSSIGWLHLRGTSCTDFDFCCLINPSGSIWDSGGLRKLKPLMQSEVLWATMSFGEPRNQTRIAILRDTRDRTFYYPTAS
jgi:hypothetical protein